MQPNRENESRGTTPVMDIQRPTMSGGQPDIIRPNNNSLGRPATMEYTRPRAESTSMGLATPAFSPAPEFSQAPVISDHKPKKSKKGLIIALIILLLLAAGGGAYYYFMVMNTEEPVPAVTQTEPVPETSSTVEATPEGVDMTIEAIDKNLNSVNDTTDFTPNDVSDDALGL